MVPGDKVHTTDSVVSQTEVNAYMIAVETLTGLPPIDKERLECILRAALWGEIESIDVDLLGNITIYPEKGD